MRVIERVSSTSKNTRHPEELEDRRHESVLHVYMQLVKLFKGAVCRLLSCFQGEWDMGKKQNKGEINENTGLK